MGRVTTSMPNAQLALFEGSSPAPYVRDWRAILRTIYGFLGLAPVATASSTSGRALLYATFYAISSLMVVIALLLLASSVVV